MEPKKFKVGDKVRWNSQSGSYSTEKIGEVVFVVPKYVYPISIISIYHKGKDYSRNAYNARLYFTCRDMGYLPQFDGSWRPEESYLVAVKTGKTDKALKKLYWPLVKNLEKVNE